MAHLDNVYAELARPNSDTLPKRDLVILPLLSLLTMAVMFAATEVTSRALWVEQEHNSCYIDDTIGGPRRKPNCNVRMKNAEGPWITYQYNECGYRGPDPCGPKPPGTVRVALIGSSMSEGLYVPYKDTFGANVASSLQRRCGRPVQLENLGIRDQTPLFVYRRMGETLSLRPDVIIFPVTPFDIEQKISPRQLAGRNDPPESHSLSAPRRSGSLLQRIQILFTDSRTSLVARHFLFEDQQTVVKMYLGYGNRSDFMHQPFTSEWEERFADFDLLVGEMAAQTRAAGVPFIVFAVPSRAEAALMSSRQTFPNVDPYAFGARIQQIAAKYGIAYADVLHQLGAIPHAENLFYVVDGHLKAEGQPLLTRSILSKLQDINSPAFASCVQP